VAQIKTDIIGHWDIVTAYRNNRSTGSLSEGYFEFINSDSVMYNLTGTPETVEYTIKDTTILVRGGSMDMDCAIDKLIDSSLVLSMTLRDIPFTLIFDQANQTVSQRANQEIQEQSISTEEAVIQ